MNDQRESRIILESPVLTVEEAADYLRIGRTKLYALVGEGHVRPSKIGRCMRFHREDLDIYLTESSVLTGGRRVVETEAAPMPRSEEVTTWRGSRFGKESNPNRPSHESAEQAFQAILTNPRFDSGIIYFVLAPSVDKVKIGTTRNLRNRLTDLQIASPVVLELLAIMRGDSERERAIHQYFSRLRSHGEWFLFDHRIRDFIDTWGQTYTESLARSIEKSCERKTQRNSFSRVPLLCSDGLWRAVIPQNEWIVFEGESRQSVTRRLHSFRQNSERP